MDFNIKIMCLKLGSYYFFLLSPALPSSFPSLLEAMSPVPMAHSEKEILILNSFLSQKLHQEIVLTLL
jgi:hypothetical protein